MFITRELHIKGMVCRRCIRVVKIELHHLGAETVSVELGKAIIKYPTDTIITDESIIDMLIKNDLQLLNDEESKLIEKIKITLIQLVEELPIIIKINISQLLSEKLGKEYSSLSKLFSRVLGVTIEKYFIHLKIEKTKELIQDAENNFSEIAYDLGYSSVNHLSNQFRQTIGMSMSEYKKMSAWNRVSLDKIL